MNMRLSETPVPVADLTRSQIAALSRHEMLMIVRQYSLDTSQLVGIEHDHRRYLDHDQLERLVQLVQRLCINARQIRHVT